ncbi:MAG: hypothetical protein SGARI_003876 [Bacillariaceae sp.]
MNRSALASILSVSAASILGLVLSFWTVKSFNVVSSCDESPVEGQRLRSKAMTRDRSDTSGIMQLGPVEKFHATPMQWKEWLASQPVSKGVTRFEPDISLSGCGMSTKVKFNDDKSQRGFFKYNDEEEGFENHIDSESHYREIKAAHFDKIVQTNVVLPTVGYHLKTLDVLRMKETKEELDEVMVCESKSNEIYNTTGVLEGSMMMWVDGISDVYREEILDAALIDSNESAIRYALFLYLAACAKTDHNHFELCTDEEGDCTDTPIETLYHA